jgi:hypothetical protein
MHPIKKNEGRKIFNSPKTFHDKNYTQETSRIILYMIKSKYKIVTVNIIPRDEKLKDFILR